MCGYHVYKSTSDATRDDDILPCEREIGTLTILLPLLSKKGTVVVSHVPRKISTMCSIFICQGCTVLCRVNGNWRYSLDLPHIMLETNYYHRYYRFGIQR